jgi:hypothetical protein
MLIAKLGLTCSNPTQSRNIPARMHLMLIIINLCILLTASIVDINDCSRY